MPRYVSKDVRGGALKRSFWPRSLPVTWRVLGTTPCLAWKVMMSLTRIDEEADETVKSNEEADWVV